MKALGGASLLLAAVALVHVALYGQVLRVGFVTDDFLWLADAGRDGSLLDHATSREPFGYFRPLSHVLFAGSRRLFGLDPVPLHVLALIAGTIAGSLLGLLIWRLFGDRRAALVGAAWFVLHPANAINLAWISSLPTLLATVGLLGSVLAWHAYRRGGRQTAAVASLLLHAFALASKEEAAITIVWLAALELVGTQHRRAWSPAARCFAVAHGVVLLVYLGSWTWLGARSVPYGPESTLGWLEAALDPATRLAALCVPRDLVRPPIAEIVLLAGLVLGWRGTAGAHGRGLRRWGVAGLALAYVALLPSSVFLWRFPYDKMVRLLHPALPAGALLAAVAVVCWRRWANSAPRRFVGAALVAVVLLPFALRSYKTVGRRVEHGAQASRLFEALRRHESLLRAIEAGRGTVTIVGYDADWVYPLAPVRALAPTLDVRVAPVGAVQVEGTVLLWHPDTGSFTIAGGTSKPR